MKAKMGVSLKSWALPLSVSGERWPALEVRLLCFVFSITWGRSGVLRDALIMADTERVHTPVSPPPDVDVADEEDAYDEEFEDDTEVVES